MAQISGVSNRRTIHIVSAVCFISSWQPGFCCCSRGMNHWWPSFTLTNPYTLHPTAGCTRDCDTYSLSLKFLDLPSRVLKPHWICQQLHMFTHPIPLWWCILLDYTQVSRWTNTYRGLAYCLTSYYGMTWAEMMISISWAVSERELP